MLVSVIIPTYNRPDSLRRTLQSFAEQVWPGDPDQVEILVVDDGSTVATLSEDDVRLPFSLRILQQENQGDAAARNTGVRNSQAEFVAFVDDDITVRSDYLRQIVELLQRHPRAIVIGNLLFPPKIIPLLGTLNPLQIAPTADEAPANFTDCLSGFMAIRRADYLALGMMQGLQAKGANAWCDVDFAYRAHLQGFHFVLGLLAVGYHYDDSAADLAIHCRRIERASRSAVLLFQKHPGLMQHLPMFIDKTPIRWGSDSTSLILHKLSHTLTAARPIQWSLESTAYLIKQTAPQSSLLKPLYRWISSSYIYRGYRSGLREFTISGEAANR